MSDAHQYSAFDAPEIDESIQQPESDEVVLLEASSGRRIANYFIDLFAVGILGVPFNVLIMMGLGLEEQSMEAASAGQIASMALLVLYYGLVEGLSGRSVGKLVTNTKVVKEDGKEIGMKEAFLRSLIRLIPFEPLSFLGRGSGWPGWHDRWTKTRVVRVTNPDLQT